MSFFLVGFSDISMYILYVKNNPTYTLTRLACFVKQLPTEIKYELSIWFSHYNESSSGSSYYNS